jgi:hypothetical protein
MRLVVPAVVIGLSACGGADWAAIDDVIAVSPDATHLLLELDYCDGGRNPTPVDTVVESSTEVRVRIDIPIRGDDRDDCAGFADVQLSAPIGQRTVVDDRTRERHPVEFGPQDAPPATTTTPGSVAEPQYAVLADAAWTLREAIDPPADSPTAGVERLVPGTAAAAHATQNADADESPPELDSGPGQPGPGPSSGWTSHVSISSPIAVGMSRRVWRTRQTSATSCPTT